LILNNFLSKRIAMDFSPEQQIVFDAYLTGKNVFVTGPGGTGKSHLIRAIYKDAVAMGKCIQVCALTGCAAILLNCNAKTVHSWAKIGLGNGSPDAILQKIQKFKKTKPWVSTNLLIVDEVSMMSMKIFELLDYLGQKIRKSSRPFGGIQVIFSGDFFQLPPVPDRDDADTGKFCFESARWNATFDCQIELKTNFRQSDGDFARILNQIRVGKLYKSGYEMLKARVGKDASGNIVQPIKLFPRKYSVDTINQAEMSKIGDDAQVFKAVLVKDGVDPKIPAETIAEEEAYLRKNALCEDEVRLKKGAQVMCIANVDMDVARICNGSVGVIIEFVATPSGSFPLVKFNTGVERVMVRHCWPSENIDGLSIAQVPLILAWAVTIHKSQGATLDLMEIDIGSNVFEYGQTYVGLSRARSLEGLYIKSFAPEKIKVNPKVQAFYERMNAK
jgi:ATP-dependent DNA helicase PIF1